MSATLLDVNAVRSRFTSLQGDFVFLDAPGGSQVPDEVGDAIAKALREASANLGAGYATSHRVKAILEEAESKAARFLGCETHEIVFGPNMSSLNFTLSRTAGRVEWPGKVETTFSDAITAVRRWLWVDWVFTNHGFDRAFSKLSQPFQETLLSALAPPNTAPYHAAVEERVLSTLHLGRHPSS